jgi:anaerobic selenocysteine-containing dehydrogenase
MALPAVAGKFGVRGGGFSMSNSASWGIKAATWMDDVPEPRTRLVNMNHLGRALLEYGDPPVEMLFVYNCNPLATMPDQNRVLQGLKREDLFTVVYEQVFTDTARYADVVLPATTFLENYDIAKGYGPISLQLVRPVIEPVGDARPNAEVFSELAARLGIGEAEEEIDTLMRIAGRLPARSISELMQKRGSRSRRTTGARSSSWTSFR